MLTTKNWPATAFLWTLLFLTAFIGQACKRSASTQLLEGERLVKEGRYPEAIEALQGAIPGLRTNALAHAWNNLGLAYHGAGKPDDALRAYQQAIAMDRNLAAPRFNLGALLLEENNLGAAINELTTFTVLNPQSGEGWTQLGNALLEARRPDDAERAFRGAMNVQGQTPELLTGLGVTYAQRKRPREAVQRFSEALQKQPTYGPALFNLASAQLEFFRNDQAARALYRDYLATQPPSAPHVNEARALVARLDQQLDKPLVIATNPPAALQAPQTNIAVALPPRAQPTNTPALAATNPPARAPETNKVALARAEPPPIIEKPAPSKRETERPPPVTRAETPVNTSAAEAPPAPKVEVVQLPPEIVPAPIQDVAAPRTVAQASAPPPTATNTQAAARTAARPEPPPLITKSLERPPEEKRGILNRVNPANWFRRDKDDEAPDERPSAPGKDIQIAASQAPGERLINFPEPTPKPRPRYQYLNPPKFPAGNRDLAVSKLSAGYDAHRDRRFAEAIAAYQEAVKADPSYYEAHLNLAIAAYQTRQFDLALAAAERAIVANPDGVAAREQMAVCLQNGGFHVDAAEQLQEAIRRDDKSVRAHLQLANIYAQELNSPTAAKLHYRKVLQLDPHNPRATEIRYWLNANP